MYAYKYGGKNSPALQLDIADDLVVVRTKDAKALPDAVSSSEGKAILGQLSPVTQFPDAGVSVLQCKHRSDRLVQLRDRAREVFNQEEDIRFAGRVLRDGKLGTPVIYTENFFVKFRDEINTDECEDILGRYQLNIKRKLEYATNAYFVSAPEGTGVEIFRIAERLLDEPGVELCHPELIRESRRRAIADGQWHLKRTQVNGQPIDAHVRVEGAWQITKGAGTTIAVIDDGVDIDHEEFDAAGKVVNGRDVTQGSNDPRPKDTFFSENHGTACAGVACAAGDHQASGVAPEAKLMPIRLVSNLGSQAEADAFFWAADNGADVISCSWGPSDGDWFNPNDVRHFQTVALPDSTRLAIDHAVNNGRGGKGCVIVWAAGNGNESVENDGYASYDKVIAVAACNDQSSRSVYSDFGESIWCAFPASDFGFSPFNHPAPKTPGIWTTDREGSAGYNPGILNPFESDPPGDDSGHYTETFGGTSSACPGVAGVAALIIAANPDLRWDQVKDVLRQSPQQIDTASGDYDENGHSPFYGYGRVDADGAVRLAKSLTESDVPRLSLGASVSDTLAAADDEKLFVLHLPAAATVSIDGPDATAIDFDLYIKRGSPPTTTDYDLRGYTAKADETFQVNSTTPGEYYILVRSFRGSGQFTLKVELD